MQLRNFLQRIGLGQNRHARTRGVKVVALLVGRGQKSVFEIDAEILERFDDLDQLAALRVRQLTVTQTRLAHVQRKLIPRLKLKYLGNILTNNLL